MCVYMYIYTHMKSTFPKCYKRHSKKKWVSNVNPKFVDCRLCFGKELFIYQYIMCIYLHIYEDLLPKARSLNLAFTLGPHLLEWCYRVFEKSS